MRVLTIETASEACSVAMFDGSVLRAHDHRTIGRGHAEALVPMIAALPDRGRADRILVSLGPGSFTGVRIGLATARALGFAWQAEVLGYPTLALIAAMAQTDHPEQPVTVCMNGGHGEWFVADFGGDGLPTTATESITPETARTRTVRAVIAGNRAENLAALHLAATLTICSCVPDAAVAHLVPEALLTANLAPIYGRAPDAKPLAEQGRP